MADHKHTHSKAIQEWEQAFKDGTLQFRAFEPAELPAATRNFLDIFVTPTKCKVELGPVLYDHQHLFKIDDTKVGFVAHCAKCTSHVWGAPDFGDIDNNVALARMFALSHGIEACEEQYRQLADALDAANAFHNN